MIAPTTAIAEIALVSDISGVCSSRDTRRMTPSPMKDASTKTNSMDQKSGWSLQRAICLRSGADRGIDERPLLGSPGRFARARVLAPRRRDVMTAPCWMSSV